MDRMQVTFWPRYAPSRTLLPPGTMRMPFSGPMRCIGYVSLSRKLSVPTDISVLTPMRNPSRMPFLTQALTRQPVAAAASGSAARTMPALRAARNFTKSARWAAVYAEGFWSKSCSMSVCIIASSRDQSRDRQGAVFLLMHQQPRRRQDSLDFGQVGPAGRHHGKAPDGLHEAHQGHRGFHRNGVGLHEVDVHEGQELRLDCARGGEIVAQAGLREGRHFGGNFVGRHTDHAASPERRQRDGDGVVDRKILAEGK